MNAACSFCCKGNYYGGGGGDGGGAGGGPYSSSVEGLMLVFSCAVDFGDLPP